MKWTETLIPTLRDVPKEAEATSHQLMIRSGMIRKLSSGVYSYLPLGLKAIQKVQEIIRDEMAKAGAFELLLPALHPAELWKKTGRYEGLGADKISFKNRSDQEFVLGPTHEEVITDLLSTNVSSYKELPLILYQIQTKFRDELRPRFGVIRSKEFIMKDAYSFDKDWEGLDKTYEKMLQAYIRIFKRSSLNVEVVNADPGLMGGNISHEFMLLADFGEDVIASCSSCDFRSTPELVSCLNQDKQKNEQKEEALTLVDTPKMKSIDEVKQGLGVEVNCLVKTIIYLADDEPLACLVQGNDEISELKLKKFLEVKNLTLATDEKIEKLTGGPVGFSGPVDLNGFKIVADHAVASMANFIVGANKEDKHYKGVNLNRDFNVDSFFDIRTIQKDETCPECQKGKIEMKRAMEIGHIFKLGTRYSKPLEAKILDENGKSQEIIMGCYGIGVNRMVAGAIEQNHDEKGSCWPKEIAPYMFHIITTNQKDELLCGFADEVYSYLLDQNIDVLYDNRNDRAGVKFNDADLIGIPYQIIFGAKNAKDNKVELKLRKNSETFILTKEEFYHKIKDLI